MITKNVAKSCRVTTVTAADEVTAVVYTSNYKYFQLRNDSDDTAYLSDRADVAEGSDGTMSIPAGGCGQIYAGSSDTCYVKGAGTVLIAASNLPDWGFKLVQRGGDTPTPTPTSGGKIELTPLYDGDIPTSGSSVVEITITADTDILQICPRCLGANNSTVGYVQTVCVPISKLSAEEMQLTVYSYISSTSRMGNFLVGLDGNKVKIRASHTWLNYAVIYGQHITNETEDKPTNSDITATGNPVIMDGLQGGVPFSEITVSGKNLLKYPYMTESGKVTSGVTFTANSDGSITLNGTSTAYGSFNFTSRLTKDLLLNGTYTLSGATADARLAINATRDGKATTIIRTQSSSIFTTSYHDNDNEYGFAVFVEFNTNKTFDNVTIFPQLELGNIATEYEAPITGRELTLTVSGKNLLKYPYSHTTRTSYGVTFTDNGDGSITATGTHDGSTSRAFFGFTSWWTAKEYTRLFLSKGKTIAFKIAGLSDMYSANLWIMSDAVSANVTKTVNALGSRAVIYTAEQDCYIACGIYGSVNSVGQAVDFTAYPQLELGDTATDYEPYHGSTVIITPDSNPYIVSNDIRQQDGHNVITVSDGTLSVTGCKSNMAVKRIWDKLDELATAIIVSNGENE